MYHELLRHASFWTFLFTVDESLAEDARMAGCACGGRLHRANYPRKPNGGCKNLPKSYAYRLSFCCERDNCRQRKTPASVRFLGRKVYLGAVVVLVAAMRQGPSPRRVEELHQLFGVDVGTIARWRKFWCEHFPQTQFWKVARCRLPPGLASAELPLVLLKAFIHQQDCREEWQHLLVFLSPITITGGLVIEGNS